MEQRFHYEPFSQEEHLLGDAEMKGESDPVEKLFLQIAKEQGLLVYEAGMIRLPRKQKKSKGDKRATVPDFLIKEKTDDEGIFIEVTVKNERSGSKGAQLKVMEEAGLTSRYAQITKNDLDKCITEGKKLLDVIREKISSNE